jgi:uncharacterized small protein (DUF1192 family)
MTEEEDNEVWQPENPTDFKIYDVPTELKNDYISMAKLHYDDDVWKVMADAMASLKEDKFGRVDILQERVSQLQDEVAALKAMIGKSTDDEDDDLTPTLGD